ncbi:alpha-galactosidase [Psychromicrobium lacuslunae]|uniref:Alpha-galactosidase n=1 Tax=Psychromicrobium lacuslunae TaxID=1618207 RepID=A0A0D4C2H6_9MICC|nr:alpha-galactosidase [Psychromicrobium lacuslunae]
MKHPTNALISLQAAQVALVLDCREGRLPEVVHWGEALGALSDQELLALAEANISPVVSNMVDLPVRVAILPAHSAGWLGRPGLSGSRDGTAWSPQFTVSALQLDGHAVEGLPEPQGPVVLQGQRLIVQASDPAAQLGLRLEIEMTDSGLLRARAELQNQSTQPYQLDELNFAFPVPLAAQELLDFAGHWGKERVPQRSRMTVGSHLREGRKGRTGSDAATLLCLGKQGFCFQQGEVWSVHLGFSGNHRHYAERTFHGVQLLGAGELLLPGEVRLTQGQSYQSPWVYASYGQGLDEVAAKFHRFLRELPGRASKPRPATLNVWEAVYFDHDLERLLGLAETAAHIGVERFVLDDGWFLGRRDDRAGLGDWYVDPAVWPNGLAPLVGRVGELGMEFGLWFEPEMVNLDSELARRHPEWVMATGDRLPVESRHQQVLNLAIPEAYEFIRDRMVELLTEYSISYIKWDHNRDLVDAGRQPSGVPSVHEQTLATYRLMDELKARFPELEIESCSSGGARVDLGVLERTDRVWASDCIDPLERQHIDRWTGQLIPPELIGSHVASTRSHTTGRRHDLSFRAGTALFGHFGIEWDLNAASAEELAELADWIRLYQQERPLLHSGKVVRVDHADPSLLIRGVVSADQRQGLFQLAYLSRSEFAPRGRFQLAGLDPEARYQVRLLAPGDKPHGLVAPHWLTQLSAAASDDTQYSGAALQKVGLQLPEASPEQIVLLKLSAL